MSDSEGEDSPSRAVVLDYLPRGRADDDRPQYKKSPVAFAVNEDTFALYEMAVDEDAGVSIGDRVPLDSDAIERYHEIEYEDLSSGAQSELDYAIEEIVEAQEREYVDFYNEAQPITLRLHQLNLLPGIGKKLRNNILDERKRKPFESFEELEERVSGLHSPREVLIERIVEEIRDDDLKYRTLVRRDEQ
jgi:putative nucleotide binding protein